jgi:hypothetical protein
MSEPPKDAAGEAAKPAPKRPGPAKGDQEKARAPHGKPARVPPASRARAEAAPSGKPWLIIGGVGAVLLLLIIAIAVGFRDTKPQPAGDAAPTTKEPEPASPARPTEPTPAPSEPSPAAPKAESSAPLKIAEDAIREARRLAAANERAHARSVLEEALRRSDVVAHAIASESLRREIQELSKNDVTPAAEPEEKHEPAATEKPAEPAPSESAHVDAATDAKLKEVRDKEAALDLTGAIAALAGLDAKLAATEREEIDARAAFLDALGAAIPDGSAIAIAQGGKRYKITKVSSKGVETAFEGAAGPIPWSKLPRPSVLELVSTAESKVQSSPLGSALVLYDLGIWASADRRVHAWIEADPKARSRALAIVARARGISPVPEFVWKGEWLTPTEEEARAKDLVTVDGRLTPRDEARKLVEKLKRERRPAKAAQQTAAKARAQKELEALGVVDVRTILRSGDPVKRADIVVISDGFAKEEVGKFERLADTIARTVLTIEPFKNYSHYVNVHRVTVVEEKSGIAGGGTRLGSRVSDRSILTCDREAAWKYGRLAPDCDLVIVCANVRGDVRATGGSGVMTVDASGDFNDVVLHEMGHAFGGLDDEYVEAGDAAVFPDYGDPEEPAHINSTRQSNPKLVKWHYWSQPPALPDDQRTGCFPGSYYRATGYYRPAKTCRMREPTYRRYCAVCLEQLEKRFYARLEPIDDASPRSPVLAVYRDETQKLSVTAIAIEQGGEKLGGFAARWFVDGRPVQAKSSGIKSELEVRSGGSTGLAPGDHEVAVRVDLRDVRVRRDDGLLSSGRAWRVTAIDAPRPKIVAPERQPAKRGEPVVLEVTLEQGPDDLRLSAAGPPGSSFTASGRSGRFFWVPPRDARGAFPVTFTTGEGPTRVDRSTEIVLQDEDHDTSPMLADPGVAAATRGEPFELRLEATDLDGDALVFSAPKGLPPGATLDPAGVLRWTPDYSSPYESECEISVRVSDGKLTDDMTFKAKVENKPIGASLEGFDLLVATRSSTAATRLAALAALESSSIPPDGRALECARLLRDPDGEVSKKALEIARGLDTKRDLLAIDLVDHVWQLSDYSDAIDFLEDLGRGVLSADAKSAGARIAKDVAAVKKYNADRGK